MLLNRPPFTGPDADEYSRIIRDIVGVLQEFGGYVPAIDDLDIDWIARNRIHASKLSVFLNSEMATPDTYSRVADAMAKFGKNVDTGMRRLAISRVDRLSAQAQTELATRLKERILKGLEIAGETVS